MKSGQSFLFSRPGLFLAACALLTSSAMASPGHGNSSIGEPGKKQNVTRTIQVDAADNMRFTPDNVTVKKGETVRFVIRNSGKVPHEFSLGTEKDLKEHYEVMKKHPNMEHEEENMVSLKPGQEGEVIWKFTRPGVVHFACLHVGHYDAGMKGQVRVSTK